MRLIRAPNSLAQRLTLSAAFWAAIALLITGFVLSASFRTAARESLSAELEVVAQEIFTELEVGPDGAIQPLDRLIDPRFGRAFSGRYWQIVDFSPTGPVTVDSARSLLGDTMFIPTGFAPDAVRSLDRSLVWRAAGPNREPLLVYGRIVRIDGRTQPFAIVIGADETGALVAARRFDATISGALFLLGLGLIIAVLAQVQLGLQPLNALGDEIVRVREGQQSRLEGRYPAEINPLAQEMNALLDHNLAVVERARTQVGNLAHALKTPLSVVLNECRSAPSALSSLVERQAEVMTKNVEHYLKRAAAVARAESLGARTDSASVLRDIVRTLQRLYGRDGTRIDLAIGPVAPFRGEQEDFSEMVGNLIENACKYGGGLVEIVMRLSADATRLVIEIDDDGPGLSEEDTARALRRGVRLDETTAGSGLGLAIVAELAEAYMGSLTLGPSTLGGLRAVLELPIVSRDSGPPAPTRAGSS